MLRWKDDPVAMKIEAHEFSIGDVLSDRFLFTIPLYQRPYAWTTEETGEMVDDLILGALSEASLAETDPYFLGSVVLVKAEESADAEVIDGQQRLTTLTILLSVLREFVPDRYAAPIEARIFQSGDPIRQIVDRPRVRLRDQDQGFFEGHIQRREGLSKITSIVTDGLSESQRNLIENAKLIRERLDELSEEDCVRLLQYVDRRTYLVAVATQDFESAYRIFRVLNERGLDLTVADILKSEIIGTIPEPEQGAYTKKWEAEEDDLGRDEFEELFSHIRMVFAKTKAREAILKEFRTSVLAKFPDSRTFVDEVLIPLSDAYEVVVNATYKSATGDDRINQLLRWLNRLDNFDWIPPAISYLRQLGVTAEHLLAFLTDLERLAASMLVRRVDVSRRIERYGLLLQAIEDRTDLYQADSPLQLTPQEQKETLDRLAADIYTVTRTRMYIMLRLDSALSAGGATYDYPTITVEHVLPQNPAAGSLWRTWFTDAQRQQWVHRLANLALLPRRKNAEASNLEFDLKKQKYFTTKSGVVPFAVTTQILMEKEWRPGLLQVRQQNLLNALATLWRLH